MEFINLNVSTNKWEICGTTYKVCDCFLEYANFKDDLIECKCLYCNKNYQQNFDEKLKEQLLNVYNFFNGDNNKFVLLLRNSFYLCKYLND